MTTIGKEKITGYLLRDWPGIRGSVSLGLQLFLAIFAATIFVAIVTGFNISVTLAASGLATLVALTVNRFRIPLYYGSSFSAIIAVQAIVAAYGGGETGIRVAQVGIVVAGVIQILVGLAVMKGGPTVIRRVLPPIVTGPTAMIIAYGLSGAAISMSSGTCCLTDADGEPVGSLTWWLVASVTALVTILWSKYLRGRGLIGMLPILGGAAVGYLVAIPLGLVNFAAFSSAQLLRVPPFTLPAFGHPGAIAAAITISVVVIATVPESVAHLVQIDEVVQRVARSLDRKEEGLRRLVGLNLASDGSGDIITGLLGGPMGTNYGEGIATMLLSNAVTVYAVLAASLFAVLASASGHLEAAITTVPTAVVGGLSLYLFGAFGLVGVKMLMDVGKEEILRPGNLAIASLILILGIGGGNAYGGSLPIPLPPALARVFPGGIPAIAAAALVGILLNLILDPAKETETAEITVA